MIGDGFQPKSTLGCKVGTNYSRAIFHSNKLISCIVPGSNIGYHKVLFTPNGIDWVQTNEQYRFVPNCQIISISPRSSPRNFKGLVNITGNFKSLSVLGSHHYFCKFGRSKSSITLLSLTSLSCSLPEADKNGVVEVDIVDEFDASLLDHKSHFEFEDKIQLKNVEVSRIYSDSSAIIKLEGSNLKPNLKCRFDFDGIESIVAKMIYINETAVFCRYPQIFSQQIKYDVIQATVYLILGNLTSLPASRVIFNKIPVIGSISPSLGKIDGGTLVTICASSNFNGWMNSPHLACRFGSLQTKATWINARKVECQSPPSENLLESTVIVAVTDNGFDFSSTGEAHPPVFEYSDLPIISSISPDFGFINSETSVLVQGEGFMNRDSISCVVIYDDTHHIVPAIYLKETAIICHLEFSASMNTTRVKLEVTNNGVEYSYSGKVFAFVPNPFIASFHPKVGYVDKRTEISLDGYFPSVGFRGIKCGFHGGVQPLVDAIVFNQTTVICSMLCPDQAGLYRAYIQIEGMESQSLGFPFVCEVAPDILAVVPKVVSINESLNLTLKGTNFSGNDKYCSFVVNGTILLEFAKFLSRSSISCPLPVSLPLGVIDVSTSKNGQGFVDDNDSQIRVIKQVFVKSLSPKIVPVGGIIKVEGDSFDESLDSLNCEVGGAIGQIVEVISSTLLTCRISVHTPIGSGISFRLTWNGISFTEVDDHISVDIIPLPKIDYIQPKAALRYGGSNITIYGSHFLCEDCFCIFGDTLVQAYLQSNSRMTCSVPVLIQSGFVELHLSGGLLDTKSFVSTLYFSDTVRIRSIYPRCGDHSSSTEITIWVDGLDQNQLYDCNFDGYYVSSIFASPTALMCVVPPIHLSERVEVSIALSEGHLPVSEIDSECINCNIFTYYVEPYIYSMESQLNNAAGYMEIKLLSHNFPSVLGDNDWLDVHCKLGNILEKGLLVEGKLICTIPTELSIEDLYLSVSLNGVNFFGNFKISTLLTNPSFLSIFPSHGSQIGGTYVSIKTLNIEDKSIADW